MAHVNSKLTHSTEAGWVSLAEAKGEDGLYECDYDGIGSPHLDAVLYVVNEKAFLLDDDGIEGEAEIKKHYKDFRYRRLPKDAEFVLTLTQE